MRDTHTHLSKKRSGDGAPEFTQREAWILESFAFLKKVVRHRSEPINSLKNANVEDILDKENQSVHAEDEEVDTVDPEKTSSDSSGRNSKRIKCNDHVLQTLQENLVESGKIIQDLSKPQPVTSVTTFASYVRDSLVTLSMKKFKRARSSINATLTKLMDEDSDDPEQPLRSRTGKSTDYMNLNPAASPYADPASEMYQSQQFPNVFPQKPSSAPVWRSQVPSNYDAQYQHQSQWMYQEQPHRLLQVPGSKHMPSQPRCSTPVSSTLRSAAQVLDDNNSSSLNISGISALLNRCKWR